MLNEYDDTFESKQMKENGILNAEIINLQKTAANLEESLAKERKEKAVLESEVIGNRQLVATLAKKLYTANQNIEETQAYTAKLKAENEMYRTSFSWRLTLPLRFMGRLVLAVLHGPQNIIKKLIIKLRNSKVYPVLNKCIPRALKRKLEAKYFHDAEAKLLLYNTTQENEILKLVEGFEKTVDTKDKLLLVFSGVKYVDHEGQRGIRLIHEARQLGVRVVFAYWRWSKNEQVDESEEDLVKIPIDILASQQVYFFENFFRNIPDKTLLVEFPHPLVTQIIEIANSFGWKTVYDVIDDWEEFSKCGQAGWYRKEAERKISNIVDINVATAYVLRDKIKKDIVEDKPYYVITNGVDPNRMKKSEKIAEYDYSKGSMQIGYFGHLTDAWFDWDMLQNIAEKHPEWTFHLIGYGAPDSIDLPDNIILYGKQAPEELPKYAAYWDVAIIPFINNELTRGVNPIKVFEYLQLRLPVVASNMPEIAGYPYVTIAVGENNFEKAVKDCAGIVMDDEQVQRFIEKNTWKNKCLELLNGIEDIEKTY